MKLNTLVTEGKLQSKGRGLLQVDSRHDRDPGPPLWHSYLKLSYEGKPDVSERLFTVLAFLWDLGR